MIPPQKNHWIKRRGKGASVSRPWFKFDFFQQYLETIDGVLNHDSNIKSQL